MTAALLATPVGSVLAQEQYQLREEGWEKIAAPEPGTPEGQLQQVRRLMAEDQPKDARKAAKAWIESHPNHPLLVEAHLLRGDAYTAQRDYYKALYDYEYVIRQFPASEQFHTALEREYEIARLFSAGVKRKFLGMPILGASAEAEEILVRIQERAPGSAIGEKAMLTLGDHYFDRAEMSGAVEVYDLFLLNYPRSQFRERAMLRLIQASLATFKGPRFDATGLIEASQRLKAYREEFPAAADRLGAESLLVRIDESLALKTLYTGQWYRGRNRPVSARYIMERVVRDYPQTSAARQALEQLQAHQPAQADEPAAETQGEQPAGPASVDPVPPNEQPAAGAQEG